MAVVLAVAAPAMPLSPVALPAGAAGETSRFVAIAPVRLTDTRVTPCTCSRIDQHTISVAVTGQLSAATLPAGDVVAAAVTITSTTSTGSGFITAYPAGSTRPPTSTLNARSGRDTSNSSIVSLGAGGAVEVYAQTATDLVVDVTGVFVAAATSTAGRFRPVTPTRLLDTRDAGQAVLVPGATVTIPLPASVAGDATAVAVNVTSVGVPAAGFLTGYAAGSTPPPTSFLNPDGSGSAQAASVILPVSSTGFVIASSTGGHVIVDLVGWFTGASSTAGADGLFVPLALARVLDTRATGPRLWPGGTREIAAVNPAAAAIVTNVTLASPDDPGFVTAYPAGTPRPSTSSINAAGRDALAANMAITPVSTRGSAYFSSRGTDLVVDIAGYFTGSPVAATLTPEPNVAPVPRVLLLGDSTLGVLNVVPQSQAALRGFVPVVDAEPCRRLVRPSCRSAFTNRIPNTAVEAIAATPGPLDMVVMRGGYNDGSVGFDAAVDAVVRAARARGVRWVVWLTYSDGTGNQVTTYLRHNATLRQMAASGRLVSRARRRRLAHLRSTVRGLVCVRPRAPRPQRRLGDFRLRQSLGGPHRASPVPRRVATRHRCRGPVSGTRGRSRDTRHAARRRSAVRLVAQRRHPRTVSVPAASLRLSGTEPHFHDHGRDETT